jgi:uncharacterized protein
MSEITENPSNATVTFAVRVQPGASKDEIAGEYGDAIKIRLSAPAVDGQANEALIDFFSQLLKTPKSTVRILSGERSRSKRIEIQGVSKRQIERLLTQEA